MKRYFRYFRYNKTLRRVSFLIFFLVLSIGLGYSFLTTALSIEGTTKVNIPGWDVHFENIVVDNSSMEAITPATIVNPTTINYSLEFENPGDFYQFNVDVVNNGTVDAMIESINLNIDESISDYFTYSITYYDGMNLNVYDLLEKEIGKENLLVNIKLNDDVDIDSIEYDDEFNFELEIVYVQADSNANDVVHNELLDFINKAKAELADENDVGKLFSVDIENYGTFTLRVENVSKPTSCNNSNFSQSACGVVLGFKDCLLQRQLNTTPSNSGGWPNTTLKTYLNETVYNDLPDFLREAILSTKVVSGHGSGSSSDFVSNDYLYLLSPKEIFGTADATSTSTVNYDTARDKERQTDYYSSINVTNSNFGGAKRYSNGISVNWWTRTPMSNSTDRYTYVHNTGGSTTNHHPAWNDGNTPWACPCFRIY